MHETLTTDEINKEKHSFQSTYNEPNPCQYFKEMLKVDYQIPQSAKPTIEFLIYETLMRRRVRRVSVLDIGCSYGVLSSLIKFNLDLSTLYAQFSHSGREIQYASYPCRDYIDFYGLDTSQNAIDYSRQNGLLTAACAANLEEEAPNILEACCFPASCDIVVSTGCYGYITERTFYAVLTHMKASRPSIIATFVMDPFDFSSAAETLKGFGYATRQVTTRKFKQRRFVNDRERHKLTAEPRQPNLDDYIYATLHISEHSSAVPTDIFL